MRSIRSRMLALTAIAISLTICASGVVVFALTRASLYDQFDEALVSKASALAAQVEEDEGRVESEIPAGDRDMFELWTDGSDIPVMAWQLKDGYTDNWTLYDLTDSLRTRGWLVPAYPMPEALTSLTVARVVVRNGLSRDLAAGFVEDLTAHVHDLENLTAPLPGRKRVAFHH